MAVLFTFILQLLKAFVSDSEKSRELWTLGWMREQSLTGLGVGEERCGCLSGLLTCSQIPCPHPGLKKPLGLGRSEN